MKFAKLTFKVVSLASLSLFITACSGRGNVDLSKATKLTAEPVATPPVTPATINPLFNRPPGSSVSMKSLGAIDATGTSLVNDYDGDGLPNNLEITTNPWVADYPYVEASIAPPVTMKIQMLTQDEVNSTDVITQINADDVENLRDTGADRLAQNQTGLMTEHIVDKFSSADLTQSNAETVISRQESHGSSSGGGISIFGCGGSFNEGSSDSYGYTNAYKDNWGKETEQSSVINKFLNIPTKNDLQRDAISIKSDSAARNARTYRANKRTQSTTFTKIKPNAGYVRAALYIKNLTTNIPVHLTNILASLMFETNTGELVPVQSFRLRNEDFSLFSVSVYGGSSFGPYVIDLPGLNTVFIEQAIASGYNPKIFIVDYEMTHVPDSNYRAALVGYSGNNLKIVEENAKGRTALVKFKGPGVRDMFRVAVFTNTAESAATCPQKNGEDQACPGISFRKALERIKDARTSGINFSSAYNIEYADYIFDFSDIFPLMPSPLVYTKALKNVAGVSNNVPCESISSATAISGATIQLCKVKQISQWTQSELDSFGLWAVFGEAKYYSPTQYDMENSAVKLFHFETATGTCAAPAGCDAKVLRGLEGTLWVGDYVEVTYLKLSQFLSQLKNFGNNPLETRETITLNTKWDLGDLQNNVFDPQYNTRFLGQANLGDKIEVKVKIKDTQFLNPNFGMDKDSGPGFRFDTFSYQKQQSTARFSLFEAIDFEVNLGTGGKRENWANILRSPVANAMYNDYGASNNGNGVKNCGKSMDFVNQEFTLCFQLPASLPLSGDGAISVYLRPVLNNAYRNTLWPAPLNKIKKFQARVAAIAPVGSNTLEIERLQGEIDDLDAGTETIYIQSGNTDYPHNLNAPLTPHPTITGRYIIDLSHSYANPNPAQNFPPGALVYALAGVSEPQVSIVASASSTTDFFTQWNTENASNPFARYLTPVPGSFNPNTCSDNGLAVRFPTACLGYQATTGDFIIGNWAGSSNFDFNWADAGRNAVADFPFGTKNMTQSGFSFGIIGKPQDATSLPFQTSTTAEYSYATAMLGKKGLIVRRRPGPLSPAGIPYVDASLFEVTDRYKTTTTNAWSSLNLEALYLSLGASEEYNVFVMAYARSGKMFAVLINPADASILTPEIELDAAGTGADILIQTYGNKAIIVWGNRFRTLRLDTRAVSSAIQTIYESVPSGFLVADYLSKSKIIGSRIVFVWGFRILPPTEYQCTYEYSSQTDMRVAVYDLATESFVLNDGNGNNFVQISPPKIRRVFGSTSSSDNVQIIPDGNRAYLTWVEMDCSNSERVLLQTINVAPASMVTIYPPNQIYQITPPFNNVYGAFRNLRGYAYNSRFFLGFSPLAGSPTTPQFFGIWGSVDSMGQASTGNPIKLIEPSDIGSLPPQDQIYKIFNQQILGIRDNFFVALNVVPYYQGNPSRYRILHLGNLSEPKLNRIFKQTVLINTNENNETFPGHRFTMSKEKGVFIYAGDYTSPTFAFPWSAMPLDANTVFPILYGVNNFVSAPLIERNFDVTTRILPE